MKIGFARQSTTHQKFGLENQVELLTNEGCEKIFCEEISGASAKRPEFEKAIEFAREGDTFVVTALSRFGRSLKNILDHVAQLESKKVAFKILDLNIDTSTASGKLVFNLIASIYQFELEILLERQKIGIEKAKAQNKFVGRKPTARLQTKDINELVKRGWSPHEIKNLLKISLSSVYRYKGTNIE